MTNHDETLRRYLEAVERVTNEKRGVVDPATRIEIARELGWSEDDLRQARAQGEAHLEAARGCLRHQLWSDAVKNLQQAGALLPDDPRVHVALAMAHARLRRRRARSVLAILGVLVVAIPVWLAFATAQRAPERVPAEGGLAPTLSPTPSAPSVVPAMVTVRGDSAPAAIWFDQGATKIAEEYDGLAVGLYGRVEVAAGHELEELRADLVQLDEANRELDRTEVRLYHAFYPPLRAGDTTPFYVDGRGKPGVTHFAIDRVQARTRPAPASYDASKPLPLRIAAGVRGDLAIAASMRRVEVRAYDDASSALDALVELTNEGAGDIDELEVRVECLGEAGQVLDRDDETVAYGFMPDMRAKERRVLKASCFGKGRFTGNLRVVVTKRE